jgi:hypothetical protein
VAGAHFAEPKIAEIQTAGGIQGAHLLDESAIPHKHRPNQSTMNHTNIDQSRNLKDFLVTCHLATAELASLAESLRRSVLAAELEGEETPHPDGVLIKLLAERIIDLNQQISDFL